MNMQKLVLMVSNTEKKRADQRRERGIVGAVLRKPYRSSMGGQMPYPRTEFVSWCYETEIKSMLDLGRDIIIHGRIPCWQC